MYQVPFTISDVADLLSIQRLKGGTEDMFNVECPFCGDARGKCNFCVMRDGEIMNVFHCYDCGAGGNMLTLYADLAGIQGKNRYKKAYWQIKRQIRTGGKISRQRQQEQERRIRKKKEEAAKPVDYTNRHEVYLALIKMLRLKERHKDDLRRRGLSETEICRMEEKGYKSTDESESKAIARKLIKQGFRLEGVPGFFINREGDWEIAFYWKNRGYLCPVWSEKGLLVAFQIRLDHPYKKQKYVWLTSTNMEKGCSSGSPVGISGNPNVSSIRVTEGILKGEIAYQRSGDTYLGNPGVANYKEMKQALAFLKERGLKEVFECYDMDKRMPLKCRKDYDSSCCECEYLKDGQEIEECPKKRVKRDNIRKGCLKLYDICEELELNCQRVTWDLGEDGYWLENYKGIDDWKNRKEQEVYEEIREAA